MNGDNQNNNGYNPFEENHDNDYLYQTVTRRGKNKTAGWSLAALLCGIFGALSFLSYTGIIIGILAIVFSVISRKNLGYFDGKCVAAIILGIIAICLSLTITLLFIFNEEVYYQILEMLYGQLLTETTQPAGNGSQGAAVFRAMLFN